MEKKALPMFQKKSLNDVIARSPADEGGGGAPSADKPSDAPAAVDPGEILYGKGTPDANPDATAKPDVKPEGDKKPDAPKADAKPDDKAKDEKPADKTADDAKLKEVPDDGKYEFALPDGIELDAALATEAMPVLKEAGVSREGANKLAGFLATQRQKEAAAISERWEKTQLEWQSASKSDKEFGGDKFDTSLAVANKALNKFGTPELKEYLSASGGGNHPEMIRLLARIGNAFSDDQPVGSKTATDQATDPVSILYSKTRKD